jgi:hypothetical protein
MPKKKSKKSAKKSRFTMPDPWVVLSTWIQERVEHVAKRNRWSDELTEWAKCTWNHARVKAIKRGESPWSNHLNEPPIPVVIGFVAEAAANHRRGSDPKNESDRRKLNRNGDWIAKSMHRKPQQYLTNEECALLPYPIPDPIRAKKSKNSKKSKPRTAKKRM